MKANDIKKGMNVLLKNGWYATMADNRKGNIRMAEVQGNVTETGSIYAADIDMVEKPRFARTKTEEEKADAGVAPLKDYGLITAGDNVGSSFGRPARCSR